MNSNPIYTISVFNIHRIHKKSIFEKTAWNYWGKNKFLKWLSWRVWRRIWLGIPLFNYVRLGAHQCSEVRTRTFGFYHEYENAVEAILGNYGDLCEARYYTYALIEAVHPSACAMADEMQWFRWVGSYDTGFWMKSGRPDEVVHVGGNQQDYEDEFRGICHFSIG